MRISKSLAVVFLCITLFSFFTACAINNPRNSEITSISETIEQALNPDDSPKTQEAYTEPHESESSGYDPIAGYVGQIYVKTNGQEYEPFTNWYAQKEYNGPFADGMRLQPKDVDAKLPEINISDDFEIIIEGNHLRRSHYSLFDEEYNQVYYRHWENAAPSEPGTYILLIDVMWGNKVQNAEYQYFFKIVK
ncbi:MAG: hypothetical protein PHV32_02410 [Eubacteriales bacterium]|nr:hypothetical protein [Eubacteriales bacterium]